MAIIGERPESGVRLELERPRGEAAPFRYEGSLVTPNERTHLTVEIDASGEVVVTAAGVDDDTLEKVRLLIRAACKHARAEDRPPPLRIQRWRPSM
jgi:hypothetical protein